MTTLTAFGTLVAADGGTDRTLNYRLLPFGEPGRTNQGLVTASAGTLTLPDHPVVANLEHDPTRPVAWMTATETPTGLMASVDVAPTTAGNDLLAEAKSGLRPGISVEIADPVIRGGALMGGTLTGAGFVTQPAFPSAQIIAADAGDLPETQTPEDEQPSNDAAGAAESEADMAENDAATEVEAEQAPLTAGLPASIKNTNPVKAKGNGSLFAALADSNADKRTLLAALDQAIAADLLPTQQQAWLGEIYSSRTYQRKFSPLIQSGSLTALKAVGWRFVAGKTPTVGDYAGYPAEPTSTEVKTESVTLDAARIAGAGSVDRAFLDFPSAEFWAAYFREVTNDYERKADAKARDTLIAGATPVVAGAVPAGVATAAAYIVDGAISVINAERDLPSFAIVGADLYRGLLLTRADDVIAFLNAALGLQDGTLAGFKIVPSSVATLTGKVLVGARTGATQYELPGSPVRVDAVNISQGGAERGVFGYHAELINDAASLALVASA